jgi:hypothetical protein
VILKVLNEIGGGGVERLLDIINEENQNVVEDSVVDFRVIQWVDSAPEVVHELLLMHDHALLSVNVLSEILELSSMAFGGVHER